MHRPEVNRCFVRPAGSTRPPLQKALRLVPAAAAAAQTLPLHKKEQKKQKKPCAPANLSDVMGAGVSNALRLRDEIIAV